MNIQDELQSIHHQYGVSEKANYEIQKLFEKYVKEQADSITGLLTPAQVQNSFTPEFFENSMWEYHSCTRSGVFAWGYRKGYELARMHSGN